MDEWGRGTEVGSRDGSWVEGRKLGRGTEVESRDELNTGSYGDQEKRREVWTIETGSAEDCVGFYFGTQMMRIQQIFADLLICGNSSHQCHLFSIWFFLADYPRRLASCQTWGPQSRGKLWETSIRPSIGL